MNKKIKKWDEVTGAVIEENVPETVDPVEDAGRGPSISRNYMRGIEDMVEQNDNNLDGVINNVAPEYDPGSLADQAMAAELAAENRKSVLERIKEEQEKIASMDPGRKLSPVVNPCLEV
ncbi:DUF4316 domain-containing protein [Butyrivibrio sp. INlla14]|uniref:DUF4316 domain-containing protein n=1 Tax=Butyrivibrio sp. INlla14 TaxID=1520808 RepID=UPI00087646DD|nr:DUF4316 domain-containing protein [Butyrivibrio sp. INlla14]SCY63151.1 protein of unknown function [Butyrivibrio sp. INlla14]